MSTEYTLNIICESRQENGVLYNEKKMNTVKDFVSECGFLICMMDLLMFTDISGMNEVFFVVSTDSYKF